MEGTEPQLTYWKPTPRPRPVTPYMNLPSRRMSIPPQHIQFPHYPYNPQFRGLKPYCLSRLNGIPRPGSLTSSQNMNSSSDYELPQTSFFPHNYGNSITTAKDNDCSFDRFLPSILEEVHKALENVDLDTTVPEEGPKPCQQVIQPPSFNTASLISALTGTSNYNALAGSSGCQENTKTALMSDIHEEVTKAAKTLFSKRNRTLLHWLNPTVSKTQLKSDVNAAWDILPQTEKYFYISQVLGKFAPHTTSLMVNPQLGGPVKKQKVATVRSSHPSSPESSQESVKSPLLSQTGKSQEEEKVKPLKVKRKYTKRTEHRRKRRKHSKNKLKKEKLSSSRHSKHLKESQKLEKVKQSCKDLFDLEDDAELVKEIEKFKLLSEEVDDFWDNIPDPDDLFIELDL